MAILLNLVKYGYDFNKLIWIQKRFGKTTSYNIISMIILNNYETVISLCTDNHNDNPERFRSFCRKISQSKQNSRK